eukprot:3013649-Pyramimonas_sp.AAC.2
MRAFGGEGELSAGPAHSSWRVLTRSSCGGARSISSSAPSPTARPHRRALIPPADAIPPETLISAM